MCESNSSQQPDAPAWRRSDVLRAAPGDAPTPSSACNPSSASSPVTWEEWDKKLKVDRYFVKGREVVYETSSFLVIDKYRCKRPQKP